MTGSVNTNAMDEKRLGQVVQAARRAAGLTQQALCQKSGLSYSTLAKIERGAIKSPSVFTIQTIATTVGVSLDDLLGSLPSPATRKKVSKNGVRFVYFDMNDCLIRSYRQAFNRLAEAANVTPDVVESVFWQHNAGVNLGEVSVDALNTALAERLGIMVNWYEYYLESVEITPGISELVTWAADNYRVGILTNTMPGLVEALMERGLLPPVKFDVIVDSSVVGLMKPDPRIFELAAEQAGLAPSEILLVDDDRPNLMAAGRLGWHTLWFDAYHPDEAAAGVRRALEPAE